MPSAVRHIVVQLFAAAIPTLPAVAQSAGASSVTELCEDRITHETLYTNSQYGFQFRFPPGYRVTPASAPFIAKRASKASVVLLVGVSDMATPEQIAFLRATAKAQGASLPDSAIRALIMRQYDSAAPLDMYTRLNTEPIRRYPEVHLLQEGMRSLGNRRAHYVEALFTDTTSGTKRTVRHLSYLLLGQGRLYIVKATADIYDFKEQETVIRNSLRSLAFTTAGRCTA